MKAIKHDKNKPALHLLSTLAIEVLAMVLEKGARKYASHNWRLGLDWSRLLRANIGHLFAFMRGEDFDCKEGCCEPWGDCPTKEHTCLPHLANAMCCNMFLLENFLTGNGIDDRWDEAHRMPRAQRVKRIRRGGKQCSYSPERRGKRSTLGTTSKSSSSRLRGAKSKSVSKPRKRSTSKERR